MSNLILKKLNKKATNYASKRQKIEGCASEGYIFVTSKLDCMNLSSEVIEALLKTKIVHKIEIMYSDNEQRISFNKHVLNRKEARIYIDLNDYARSDYFTPADINSKKSIIRLTTFDLPEKHLKSIASYRNSFSDLTQYFIAFPIEPLTQIIPKYSDDLDFMRNMSINSDQFEYRLAHMVFDERLSDCFELEGLVGNSKIQELEKRIKENNSGKLQAISYLNIGKGHISNIALNNFLDEYPAFRNWMYGDLLSRDKDSIF